MTDTWAAWVANQPVLVATLLVAVGALARAVSVLFQRLETRTEETGKLAREVITVTAANTTALEAHTLAVERLTDALRSKR